jgi:hypothetical protein
MSRPTGKSADPAKTCPALLRKTIRYACRANHLYNLALSRLDQEGRFAVVTNVGLRDAVDA